MNNPNNNNAYWIRVKRGGKQTLFLHCDLNDTVQVLKERVEKINGQPPDKMRLLLGKQNLESHTSLFDCGIDKEDAELYLIYQTGEDQQGQPVWEDWVLAQQVGNAPPVDPAATAGAGAPQTAAPSGQDPAATTAAPPTS